MALAENPPSFPFGRGAPNRRLPPSSGVLSLPAIDPQAPVTPHVPSRERSPLAQLKQALARLDRNIQDELSPEALKAQLKTFAESAKGIGGEVGEAAEKLRQNIKDEAHPKALYGHLKTFLHSAQQRSSGFRQAAEGMQTKVEAKLTGLAQKVRTEAGELRKNVKDEFGDFRQNMQDEVIDPLKAKLLSPMAREWGKFQRNVHDVLGKMKNTPAA